MKELEKNGKNKGAGIELGKTYKFAGYVWTVCELDDEHHVAVIQSHGVTHGVWPGIKPQFDQRNFHANSIDGCNISNYDEKMSALYDEIKDVEAVDVEDLFSSYGSGLYLVSKEKVIHIEHGNGKPSYLGILKKIAGDSSISIYIWLGDVYGLISAWKMGSNGCICNSRQIDDCVVAPAFNLDLSKVKVIGDEILISKVKILNKGKEDEPGSENISEQDHEGNSDQEYRSIWEYGFDITGNDGEITHLDADVISQVSNALYEYFGRRSVAAYTKRQFTPEQYINVYHAITDYMESHREIEYEILKNVLGTNFEKEENWVVKTMITTNHKSRTVEHPEKFSSEQEAWNRIKKLVLADQNDNETASVAYKRDACKAMVVHTDKTFCKFFAEKADIPETPSLDGNAGEKQEMAVLDEGKTYKFAGYDWTACEVDNTGHYAVIQSHGITHGAWPGYKMEKFGNGNYCGKSIDGQDISEYDDKMRALYDSIKDVETKSTFCICGEGLFLISFGKAGFTMCANRYSKNYLKALKEAARKDAGVSQDSLVWLGTVYYNDLCYAECVGDVGECVDNQTNDYVIAPAFNIDLSKVEVVGAEIVIKE